MAPSPSPGRRSTSPATASSPRGSAVVRPRRASERAVARVEEAIGPAGERAPGEAERGAVATEQVRAVALLAGIEPSIAAVRERRRGGRRGERRGGRRRGRRKGRGGRRGGRCPEEH